MVRLEKVRFRIICVHSRGAYRKPSRPYLHMYAHSNEIEEIGVISLTGVNVESNPEMEALLGVRPISHSQCRSSIHFALTEKVHLHPFHVF